MSTGSQEAAGSHFESLKARCVAIPDEQPPAKYVKGTRKITNENRQIDMGTEVASASTDQFVF
jgi:hypothetical protein